MKLTVVTTTYNQEKYIREAIEGILMQKTNFPFQIVISDDCSTDSTREIIENYRKKYPEQIKLIENEKNLGAMGNFINTLSKVKGTEYVALCDGDDFWTDKNKLQKQVDFLEKNKDFSICFHRSRLFYQNKEKEEEIIPKNIKDITTIEDLVEENYIIANSVVYRWAFNNEDLKEIFPENIVPGDYYVNLLHAQNGKIKMFNEIMSSYRKHEEGMWWEADNDTQEKFILKYGKKMLNFYNAADKNMKLPKDAFYKQRKYIIYSMIVTYVQNDKIEELMREFLIDSEKDKELFSESMKDIVNRNIWHLDYLEAREKEKDEVENLKQELEKIKNSRWWKLRSKLKGN